MNGTGAMLAGAVTGTGLAVMLAAWLPTSPDLPSALARMSSTAPAQPSRTVLSSLTQHVGLERRATELRLVGDSPEALVLRKITYGLVGLAFPAALSALMAVVGLQLPWVLPGLASLALAGVLFLAPDLDLKRRAVSARLELRRAVCVFLELVALERVADAGATEALHRAADIGDGPAFAMLRDALLRAQLNGTPAWQGLAQLGDEVGVPELGDVADIMRVSGEDGAAVCTTLRARAASLRDALLTASAAEANAASEHMIVPVAFLGIAFMVLLGYPAFARILFG